MSIDDRNILSKLRRMGDDELKQFARMNQDNPYLFPLAFQESQDREEIRSGSLANSKRNDVPSVKDQALTAMAAPQQAPQQAQPQQQAPQVQQAPQQAQPQVQRTRMAANGGYMDSQLPEEMGIGALPERSLSNMADGGIVGYADGGDVQRFQSGGTPAGRMLDAINEVDELKGRISQKYKDSALVFPGMFKEQTDAERENAKAIMGRLNSMSPTEMRFVLENGVLPQGSSTFQPYDRNRKGNAPFAASIDNAAVPPNTAALPPPPPPAAAPPAAAAARPTGATTGATTGAGTTNVATGAGLPSLAAQFNSIDVSGLSPAQILAARAAFEGGIKAIDPVAKERAAYNAKAKQFSEQTLADLEKDIRERGDPYAKREERANKQEASIAESAERNPYLSLMEAGFAMMAGDSPYAMVNIGKGAMVGTKAYKDGLALIEKSKEKLSETRDKIEDYRINREDLNNKERRAAKTDIRNTELAGDENLIKGIALASGRQDAEVAAALKAHQESYNNAVTNKVRVAVAGLETEAARQRTVYSTDAQVRMSDADRSARASEADANRKMQEKIAGMLPKEAQMAMVLGTGTTERERLESGLRKAKELDTDDSKTIIQEYTKHVTEARKAMVEPMPVEAFVAQTRMLITAVKNKSNPQDEALVNKYAPKQ